MPAEQSRQKCSHKPCPCQVEAGQAYCSFACEEAASARATQGEVRTCACRHQTRSDAARIEQQSMAA